MTSFQPVAASENPLHRDFDLCPLQPVATCGQTAVLMILNSDLPPFKSVMQAWVLVVPCCWVKTYGFVASDKVSYSYPGK